MTIKVLLSNHLTGVLIGSGGNTIRDFIGVTRCKTLISGQNEYFPGTTDRIIVLSGGRGQVNRAQRILWEMIEEQELGNASENNQVPFDPRNTTGGNGQVEIECKFTIPASKAGLIIGKGGSNIEEIKNDTGAQCIINSKDDSVFTQERVLTVSGKKKQCWNCISRILSYLSEEEYNTKNPLNSSSDRGRKAVRSSARLSSSITRGGNSVERSTSTRRRLSASNDGNYSTNMNKSRNYGYEIDDNDDFNDITTAVTMAIPESLIGNIIGKNGQTIREIISLSGANIEVSKKGEWVEGTNQRIVSITGDPAKSQMASLIISQKLKQT